MLKGGLVGLGRMGLTHLAILNTHPGVRWSAVCDTTPLLVRNLQERIGFSGYSDFGRMLANEPLDFVVIATPTAGHQDAVEAALEANAHVFCEKPLTLSPETSERLASLARARGLATQVGYVNRFNAVFMHARSLLNDGILGPLVSYKSEMFGRTVLHRTKSGWRSKKREGGGCLYEFASHCIDLAQFFFGAAASVAGSRLARVFSEAVEDVVITSLRHESGLVGQVMTNWSDESYRRPYNRIEVVGENGRLVADQQELRIYLRHANEQAKLDAGWTVRYITDLERPTRFYLRGNEFTRQLDHFIESVQSGGVSPVASFDSATDTDKTIGMIRTDAKVVK